MATSKPTFPSFILFSRGSRARTDDLMVPNHARYQLRYTPLLIKRRPVLRSVRHIGRAVTPAFKSLVDQTFIKRACPLTFRDHVVICSQCGNRRAERRMFLLFCAAGEIRTLALRFYRPVVSLDRRRF